MAGVREAIRQVEVPENPRHILLRISDGYPDPSDAPPDLLAWSVVPKRPAKWTAKYALIDLAAGLAFSYPFLATIVVVGDRPNWFLVLHLLSIVHSLQKNVPRAVLFPQPLRFFLWSAAFTYIRATVALQYHVPLLLVPWEVVFLRKISENAAHHQRTMNVDLREGYFVGWTLSRYIFKNVDFRHADFSGATFENVQFEECNLEEVIANGATFRNCTFKKCRLDLGQLRGTTWVRTKVEQSSLTYADLRESQFDRQSTILKSDCDEASFLGGNASSRIQDPPKPLRQKA